MLKKISIILILITLSCLAFASAKTQVEDDGAYLISRGDFCSFAGDNCTKPPKGFSR